MSNDIIQGFLNIIQDDSSAYPQSVVSYEGSDDIKVVRQSVYGVCSMPPKNSLGLIFKANGMTGVRYGIFDDATNRFKGLSSGEVQIGNYGTQASIKFDANGDVIINIPTGNQLIINGDTVINGELSANNFTSLTSGFNFDSHFHTGDSGGSTSSPAG